MRIQVVFAFSPQQKGSLYKLEIAKGTIFFYNENFLEHVLVTC